MRDLDRLEETGKRKLLDNAKEDLTTEEVKKLIEGSSLSGSDKLIELVSKVYAIGYEEGYRANIGG